jgi:hypothetical protein
MNSEADLFAGFEVVDKTNGFDPLKAQFRRAEIYKRALETIVRTHHPDIKDFNITLDTLIEFAKMEIDNYG